MKACLVAIQTTLLLTALRCAGQGTFVYDQQSAVEPNYGKYVADLALDRPAQSFTPSLSSVGFIRMFLAGDGATKLYVNLRAGTVDGTIIASSDPVTVAGAFSGPVNFLFSSPVAVTPGATYFFEPELIFGTWATQGDSYNYQGGTGYLKGGPWVAGNNMPVDMWFREGNIVPEPSAFALFGLGMLALAWKRVARSEKEKGSGL